MGEVFEYSVRVSHRARRARIVVRPDLSVEVVLPRGVAKNYAAALLEKQKAWVVRSLKRFGQRSVERDNRICGDFPTRIVLNAIALQWTVHYRESALPYVRVTEADDELRLTGCTHDVGMVRTALQRWLKRKARDSLEPELEMLAHQYGYRYRKLTVRLQKSRWGSCSRGGNISLNANLLFLPPHLCRYVMLHELAHLKHHDHSERFWQTVACTDADYHTHIREMRSVSCRIPDWSQSL